MNGEKLYMTGVIILFLVAVIGGVFLWQVACIWLNNRREQRKWESLEREKDREDRLERQRVEWMGIIKDQNDRYEKMVLEVAKISEKWAKTETDYNRAKALMEKVNLEGVEIR